MKGTNNSKKIKLLLVLLGISLLVFAFFPTLGRYKHRTSYYELTEWDGSIASGYRSGSGTEIDPYIISNGSEFAYFRSQLKHTDYNGIYFELGNDIVLNKGIFDYDGTISYEIDDSIYQIEEFSNEYNGGSVNEFSTMGEFNGHLNGNLYRIYGLYITSKNESDLALFSSIGGSISNLYISNSMVYGGNNTAMLAVNSEGATISNVMIDGFVIGSGNDLVNKFNIDDINSGNSISFDGFNYPGTFISSTLSGNFNGSENNKLVINGNEFAPGEFSVSLNNVSSIEYSVLLEEDYSLSNLVYSVTSDYGAASAYLVNSNGVSLDVVVNKAYVSGKNYSSGFIHSSSGNLNFTNGYNTGNINGGITSGLIGFINSGTVLIDSVYNTPDLNSSFIYSVSSGNVEINNSFSSGSGYVIDSVSGTVSVSNSYTLNSAAVKNGEITGEFGVKDLGGMKSSSFILDTLKYSEFVNINDTLVNKSNLWVLEKDSYPILYIDDLNRPVAKINVSVYSWNTLANDLDVHKFPSEFMFSIETTDVLASVKSIEYYLHKSNTPITDFTDIEFTEYKDVVSVSEEGSYIIYAKITDGDNKTIYINSDVLIINPEKTIANVSMGEYTWSTVTNVPKYIYLSSNDELVVEVNSEFVSLENVSYYVSSALISEDELSLLSEVWNQYNEKIVVNSNENNIYYFKIVDNNQNEYYISTDYITVDGYNFGNMSTGRKNVSSGVKITSDSSITFNYSYSDSNLFVDGYNHNIVSNVLLPKDTVITIKDNINNKVYKYKTTSDSYGYNEVNKKAIYPINLFNEIGTLETMLLNESIYSGSINEEFSITLDFKNTKIENNYENVVIKFEVFDSEGNLVIPTLDSNIKKFNLINSSSDLNIESNFTGFIDYNNDNSNSIDFKINVDENIIDSSINDKKYGLDIRMIDNNTQSLLGKSYLSNIQFKYNDKVYVPYSNGVVNINLDTVNEGNLVIDTFVNNNKIEGNYSFYVCPYVSYDGINYSNVVLNSCLNIPLNIVDNYKDEYKFDIVINGNDRIFMKNQDKTLNFEMLYMSDIENPNIRVSLYEKNELTAYDQTYSLVDLKDYLYNDIQEIDNKTYMFLDEIVSSSEYDMYSLSFKNSKFNLNGYKLVFDLFDGENKVGSIEKKFIVKGDR